MLPLNYHHLYYFYVIAQKGSISLAGKELRLAQPTLSAQLKQFENYLEKKLFDREGRRLKLTEDGQEVLSYAKAIFDLGKEFMDRQGDFASKDKVRVQIGIDPLVPKTIVYLLIQFLRTISNDAYIIISENPLRTLIDQLRNHQLDMILCDQLPTGQNDDLNIHLLSKIPVHFCAHPKFRKLSQNFPKSLDGAPFILPTSSSGLAESVRSFFLEKKITPRILAEVQDVEVVRRLVIDGAGVAPLNLLTIKKAPSPRKLFVLNENQETLIVEKIYLVSKNRKIPHPLTTHTIKNFKPGKML